MAIFVTFWQWAAQGQVEFAAKSGGVDLWLSLGAPRGVCRGKWGGVCCRDLPADGRIARYPLQEVEQDRGRLLWPVRE